MAPFRALKHFVVVSLNISVTTRMMMSSAATNKSRKVIPPQEDDAAPKQEQQEAQPHAAGQPSQEQPDPGGQTVGRQQRGQADHSFLHRFTFPARTMTATQMPAARNSGQNFRAIIASPISIGHQPSDGFRNPERLAA